MNDPDDNQEVPNDNQGVADDNQDVVDDNPEVADDNQDGGDGNQADNEAPSIKARNNKSESSCKCKCKCCSNCKCKIPYDPSKEEVWVPNGANIGQRLNINLFSDTQYIGMNLFNIINRVVEFKWQCRLIF